MNQSISEKVIQKQKDIEYNQRKEKREIDKVKKIEKQKEKCLKQSIEYTEELSKECAEKSIRIRIYPSKTQKLTLKKWFGIQRWVYNKCLAMFKQNNKITLKQLRKSIINNENFKDVNQWMLNYDYDLRDEAIRDFIKNVKSNKEKQQDFKIHFKSKRFKKHVSLSVLSKKWNKKNNFYSCVFKPEILKSSEKLPINLKYTSRLVFTETNKYYLCIPKPLELQSEN